MQNTKKYYMKYFLLIVSVGLFPIHTMFAKIISINNKRQLADIIAKKGPVIVKFSTEWCPPCLRLKSVFEYVSELSFKDKIVFVEVDAERVYTLTSEYRVIKYPAILFFNHGSYINRTYGFRDKKRLEAEINMVFFSERSLLDQELL